MSLILRGAGIAVLFVAGCYVVGFAVQKLAEALQWDWPDLDEPKVSTGFVIVGMSTIGLMLLYLIGWVNEGPN